MKNINKNVISKKLNVNFVHANNFYENIKLIYHVTQRLFNAKHVKSIFKEAIHNSTIKHVPISLNNVNELLMDVPKIRYLDASGINMN